MIGKCPYGYNKDGKDDPLECSGKGICNSETGICECFAGYTGSACNIYECKNRCSGHGLCTLTQYASYDVKGFYPQYKSKIPDDSDYTTYGKSVCVCDREYYGDDCSLSIIIIYC